MISEINGIEPSGAKLIRGIINYVPNYCERTYARIGEKIIFRFRGLGQYFSNYTFKLYKKPGDTSGDTSGDILIDIVTVEHEFYNYVQYRYEIPEDYYQQTVTFYIIIEYTYYVSKENIYKTTSVRSKECNMYIGKLGEELPSECDNLITEFEVS